MSDYKTKCQNCSGHIEFDASSFAPGETRTVECPHCHLDTLLFVRRTPDAPAKPQPKASVGFVAAVSTNKFERLVFSIIRGFALFWAGLVVLLLLLATINYLVSLFTKPSEAGTPSLAGRFLESQAWQNFGVFIGVVFFLLFILTVISIVLLLLTIERNTRKDRLDMA